jgi:hypothetical protein
MYVVFTRIAMPRIFLKPLAALAALSLSAAAFGQYAWLDEKGAKQYSDMPPPASVPANRILKQPHSAAQAVLQTRAATEKTADSASAASAGNDKTPLTTAERNIEFQKRKAERAEQEKKAEEKRLAATEKVRNCERAGEYQRALESGERIARTDKNGERYFMTDEQRARELGETRRTILDCRRAE